LIDEIKGIAKEIENALTASALSFLSPTSASQNKY